MPHIVFWQNIPCPLKSAWVRALADTGGVKVTLVVESETLAWREAMGWSLPDYGRSSIIVCPNAETIGDLITHAGEDAVHVTCGVVRGCPLAARALSELVVRRARVGVISEAPDVTGWRGWVRRGIYFKDGIQFARSIDFVLAMGIQGVDWFAKCGYPSDRLFPFAYVTERIEGFTSRASQSGPPSLIYVGQFIPRKGLDILLKALGNLRKLDWELTLVGSGPMEEKCRRMIFEHGLSERVRFLGPLKNLAARLEICRSDLLLLPSRYDGWGAVVNEALMAGVPAICSDHCGARDLLQASWRGEVFAAGSVPSLRKVLARWINAGRTDVVARRIWNWSSLIEGKSLAAYFLSILNFVYANDERPVPPWLRADQNFAIAELGAESRHAG